MTRWLLEAVKSKFIDSNSVDQQMYDDIFTLSER